MNKNLSTLSELTRENKHQNIQVDSLKNNDWQKLVLLQKKSLMTDHMIYWMKIEKIAIY
jgi:hypothetical protein